MSPYSPYNPHNCNSRPATPSSLDFDASGDVPQARNQPTRSPQSSSGSDWHRLIKLHIRYTPATRDAILGRKT